MKNILNFLRLCLVDAEDFDRLWNGLFNYVWMSDMPLVQVITDDDREVSRWHLRLISLSYILNLSQEADVENISGLIHHIRSFDTAMLFVRGFFTSITNQWTRISHYRTDKFLMFVRRFLRQILFLLKNNDWNAEKLLAFSSELYSAMQILPVGLIQHLTDIYNEELAKVNMTGNSLYLSMRLLQLLYYRSAKVLFLHTR